MFSRTVFPKTTTWSAALLCSLGKMAMDSGSRNEERQEHTQSQCHGLLALYILDGCTNKKGDIRSCWVEFLRQLYSLRLSAATIYKSRNYRPPRSTDAALRTQLTRGSERSVHDGACVCFVGGAYSCRAGMCFGITMRNWESCYYAS